MTITIVGQVTTAAGLVSQVDAIGTPTPYALPAAAYLRDQAAGLGLHFGHDTSWRIGTVGHLERSRADGLMLVGRIEGDDLGDMLADGPWFLSDGVGCRATGPLEKGHAQLREVSLVRRTANVGTRPVLWARTDIATDAGAAPSGMPLRWHDTWRRAHERMSAYGYDRADRLPIVDLDRLDLTDEVLTDPGAARRRAAYRPPATAKATTTAPARSAAPRVRLDGVLLDERRSGELLDRLAFGWS